MGAGTDLATRAGIRDVGAGTDLGAYGRSGSAERTNFGPGSVYFSPRENGTIKTCGIASYELFEGFIFLDHHKILKIRGAASVTEFQRRNQLKPLTDSVLC